MLQKAVSYFFSDFNFRKQSALFKRLLYCFLLVKCCYWLVYYNILFGENAIAYTISFDIGFVKNIAFYLYAQTQASAALWFIVPLMIVCALNIFKLRIPFVSDFTVWLIIINIHNKIYPTLTGGDFLINQLLFFNIFISDKFEAENNLKGGLKICVHNFGVLAVIIQICFVYFFSALAKLSDQTWLNGTAVLLTSQVNHYSLPSVAKNAGTLNWLFIFLNYFVLVYQLLFPLVIWIRKSKKIFLIIGILMHLYIAFVMGLVSFGLVMMLCYVYFWPREKT